MDDDPTPERARRYAQNYMTLGDRVLAGECLSAKDIVLMGNLLLLVRFAEYAGILPPDTIATDYIRRVNDALVTPPVLTEARTWN